MDTCINIISREKEEGSFHTNERMKGSPSPFSDGVSFLLRGDETDPLDMEA